MYICILPRFTIIIIKKPCIICLLHITRCCFRSIAHLHANQHPLLETVPVLKVIYKIAQTSKMICCNGNNFAMNILTPTSSIINVVGSVFIRSRETVLSNRNLLYCMTVFCCLPQSSRPTAPKFVFDGRNEAAKR